jgi:phage-related protein
MVMDVVNDVKNMAQNVVNSIKSMYNAVVGNSIVPDMVNGVLDEFNNMTDGAVRDTQNLVKGVNSELAGLPSQVNPEVNMNGAGGGRAAGSGGGQTVVDMRHAVIRDDKDMLDRMRRSGLDMTGAF